MRIYYNIDSDKLVSVDDDVDKSIRIQLMDRDYVHVKRLDETTRKFEINLGSGTSDKAKAWLEAEPQTHAETIRKIKERQLELQEMLDKGITYTQRKY